MIELLVVAILLFIYLFKTKNIRNMFIYYMVFLFIYLIIKHKILLTSFFVNFNWGLLFFMLMFLLFSNLLVVIIKYLFKTEIVHDIQNLLFDIFPAIEMKYMTIFFISMLAFSKYLFINFIIVYAVAKIFKVENKIAFGLGVCGLVIREVINQIYLIETIPDININALSSNLVIINYFILIITLLGMLFSIVLLLNNNKLDVKEDIDYLKNNYKVYLYAFLSYIIAYIFLIQLFEINVAQIISIIVMLIILSKIEHKYFESNYDYLQKIDKTKPFMLSIIFVFALIGIVYIANYNIIISFMLLILYLVVIKSYYPIIITENKNSNTLISLIDSLDDDSLSFKKKFSYQILLFSILFIICMYVQNSYINNIDLNNGITDIAITTLGNSTDTFGTFAFVFFNYIFLGDINNILSISSSSIVLLIFMIPLIAFVLPFNLYGMYLLISIKRSDYLEGVKIMGLFILVSILILIVIKSLIGGI